MLSFNAVDLRRIIAQNFLNEQYWNLTHYSPIIPRLFLAYSPWDVGTK
jgi:hypothetical protein